MNLRKGILVVFVIVMAMLSMGIAITGVILYEEPEEPWQAAMHISNWTDRTLEIDLYVFGGDTLQYSFTIDPEETVTLTLTWLDVKNTLIFMHSVGPEVDSWTVYELEPGEWRSVILW